MRTTTRRRLSLFLAVAAIGPILALGAAAPANAYATPPNPNPLTTPSSPSDFELGVPSSVAKGAAPTGGITQGQVTLSEGQAAGLLLNRMRYSATYATVQNGFAATATKMGPLVNTAGKLAVALPVGVSLGANVDRMFGLDVTAGLCQQGANQVFDAINNAIASLGAADCSQWQMAQALAAIGNTDQASTADFSGVIGFKVCDPANAARCISIYAVDQTSASLGYGGVYCMFEPTASGAGHVLQALYSGNGTNWTQVTEYSPYSSGPSSSYPACVQQAGTGGYAVVGRYWAVNTTANYISSMRWSSSSPAVAVTQPGSNYADATRDWRCDVILKSGTTLSQKSGTWTANTANGVLPSPQCPAIPSTEVPTETKVWMETPAGNTLWTDTPTTPEYQNWKQTYPECGDGSCLLDLRYQGHSCFTNPGPCLDWINDPNQSTDYACYYGTHTVAISECYAYGNTFDPQKVAAGRAYANPETGQDTGQGNQTSSSTDSKLQNATIPSPESTRAPCFPSGWGALNPLEWVYMPIQCALNWAFVPRQSVLNADNLRISQATSATAIGGIQAAMTGWGLGIADGGCSGVEFGPFNIFGVKIDGQLLDACPGQPLAAGASIVKMLLATAISIGAILACLRYIATIFGFLSYGRGGPASGPTFVGSDPGQGAGDYARDPFAYIVYEQGALGRGEQRAIGGGGQREIGS